MRRALIATVVTTLFASFLPGLGGCRSCDDEKAAPSQRGAAGPTMPTGMLVPQSTGDGGGAARGEAMRIARGVKSGAWVELQAAAPGDEAGRRTFDRFRDDSRFVSLEAMTKLHEAFALALPGFDLFLPRLFGPDALTKLATELDALAGRSAADIVGLARELAGVAREHAQRGQSLWVLGP